MKMTTFKTGIAIALCLGAFQVQAREIINFEKGAIKEKEHRDANRIFELAATCDPASSSTDLDINNVRTKILNGGDMWWDLSSAKYEIPKVIDANGVKKNSLFAGALWIGGTVNDELRVAAMTYRQTGSDFWPGPLDMTTATTDKGRCDAYDKQWKVNRTELERLEESGGIDASPAILDWPAGANRALMVGNESPTMAPFFDSNKDGFYTPTNGEYPVLDESKPAGKNGVSDQPDQMIWWVYNDRGNIHSETNSDPIGLELQTTAFAYATNDELNNMTFYKTKVINRGFTTLKDCYFGQWVDADLGNFSDDYVGCDVERSLGYCYNGDDEDEGITGYGLNPPSIGVDYFQGPLDENGVELGLSHFMYYDNNSDPVGGNPRGANDFYNYLQAKWRNSQQCTYGEDGKNSSNPECDYMFPGKTDNNFNDVWTERTAGNSPNDRRFIQSSGPFTLKPGAVNNVTVACVWARASSGGAEGSLDLLRLASDKAQVLFNNNFDIIDGPNAPEVEITELENEFIFSFINVNSDKVENYFDTTTSTAGKKLEYEFQGYIVYQLKDATVSTTELYDLDKARVVFQCDIKDGVSALINNEPDATIGRKIPKLMVEGSDQGIRHTFSMKTDAFATGSNKALVNYTSYYYMVLSYANLANDPGKIEDQQFLAGRNNIKTYKVIPHSVNSVGGGLKLTGTYGQGPEITRLEGRGNGGNYLEFTKETIDEILENGRTDTPTYLGGKGPIQVKVIDPLKVPEANFTLYMVERTVSKPIGAISGRKGYLDSISDNTHWVLVNESTKDTVFSDTTIATAYEVLQGKNSRGQYLTENTLKDWGLSIIIQNVVGPGKYGRDPKHGIMEATVDHEFTDKIWFNALTDQDAMSSLNWIRAGKDETDNILLEDKDVNNTNYRDPNQYFEKIWDGRIAPYDFVANAQSQGSQYNFGFAYRLSNSTYRNRLQNLASVDIVITRDRSKWTQCIVLEGADEAVKDLTEGQMQHLNLRYAPSRLNVNDLSDTSGGEIGRSWFPGYAINLETGERLNMAFSEDSYQPFENGRDMIWNPTSNFFGSSTYPAFGGRHAIYIFQGSEGRSSSNGSIEGHSYDGGKKYLDIMKVSRGGTVSPNSDKQKLFSQVMWTIPAIMGAGFEIGKDGLPPTEVSIKLRMEKPYAPYYEGKTDRNGGIPMYSFSTESFRPEYSAEHGKAAMENINIVPNPYYGFSKYESSKIDNTVRITNLPEKCDISIYSLDGTLIRRIKKDNELTYEDWKITNAADVPIASGLYLIHVDGFDLGEKVLKWFGVMKRIDLDSF